MLRVLSTTRDIIRYATARNVASPLLTQISKSPVKTVTEKQYFSLLTQSWLKDDLPKSSNPYGLTPYTNILSSVQKVFVTPIRSVIKFSLRKGKRKTVKTVTKRFYRLNWGIWIRRYVAHNKHMWKKTKGRKNRLRQYVFTNATQSWLLDTMVTSYWRKPTYYVDDPYNPYHKREEFKHTRKAPLP